MTSRQSAVIARDSGSKKMALIHYSPRYTDKDLEILAAQAREVYPGTILTKDRMHFEIPYED